MRYKRILSDSHHTRLLGSPRSANSINQTISIRRNPDRSEKHILQRRKNAIQHQLAELRRRQQLQRLVAQKRLFVTHLVMPNPERGQRDFRRFSARFAAFSTHHIEQRLPNGLQRVLEGGSTRVVLREAR